MRCAPVLLSIALLAPSSGAEVVVRVSSDQVQIEASAAPLSDVLDRLARQTGMEVVYEGSPPRQPITLALDGRSATETVLAILEGQGLNYALVADPTGAKVRTLIIAGAAGKGTSTGSSAPSQGPRRRPTRPPPAASPEMMDPAFDEPDEEEEPFDYEDPALLGDDVPLEDAPEPPGGIGVFPGAPGSGAPAPGAGVTPFPGGNRIFPASPFTPQPFYPQPPAPQPPGAGPDQGAASPIPPPP